MIVLTKWQTVRNRIHSERSHVVVVGNQITEIVNYTIWNGTNACTFNLRKVGDTFHLYSGDPEHGGSVRNGTLEEVLIGFHPDVAAKYRKMIESEWNDAIEIIKKWPDYDVILSEEGDF